MEVISDLSAEFNYPNPVVTIGNFDGVHIGHQKIFRQVVEKAREIGGTPIAITFNPHPVRVLAPERGLKMLNTVDGKREFIARMGIKVLICIRFDRGFAHTEPDEFIKNVLVGKIGAKWVIVGHSYSFGKGKKGTTAMLRARGAKYGFKVRVVRYATVNDDVVSSSRIRSLLLRGRVCEASRMLGRAYHINGMVIKGAGRGGPLLHTPTANLVTSNELIPKEGVYAVRVSFKEGGEVYDGVANIGKNPTFDDTKMNYEVHIFDFNRNVVGEQLRLHFIDRIRDERKFSGIKELEEYIHKDIEKAKEILSRRKDPLFL
ncbi:MAG TPA: bifunctional riboflavin kinase/FAD synthetase [Dissulfurispiraceae bacterium]